MIRVEGLRKSFGDVRAVAGVDLEVERGEILVLLGQNGAGKSTTLRCLGGILRPDGGLIELDGLRLPESLDSVRARLGVVPDQARIYGRNTAPEYLDHFGYLYGVPAPSRRRRLAIMRSGVVVTHVALDELRQQAGRGRRFIAHLARGVPDPEPVSSWLGEHALDHSIDGDRLHYTLPWQSGAGERADFAARLQALLAEQGAPFHELEEEETSLESVYLEAMAAPDGPPHPALRADLPTRWGGEGIRAPRMFR